MKFHWKAAAMASCLFFAQQVSAQQVDQLPAYHKEAINQKHDWMIHPGGAKAALYQSKEGYLVLSNGLVSRSFEVKKNGATVGLENLMTGENMLRSIRPEAVVEINGLELPVGGLVGQPIHNYLLEEWVEKMQPDPKSLQLVDYSIGETEARFEWKKRPEWMPKDLPWPAPGKKISFSYRAGEELIKQLAHTSGSDQARAQIFRDEFKSLGTHWEIQASPKEERNSFINEGKPGEILAMGNQYVAAKMANRPGAKVWIVQLDPGTDASASWGPGIALESSTGSRYRLNVRPGEGKFGFFDGKNERVLGTLEPGRPIYLRLELDGNEIQYGYSYSGKAYVVLGKSPVLDTQIAQVWVGKLDSQGRLSDAETPGAQGRSKIMEVQMLGEVDQRKMAEVEQMTRYLTQIEVKVHYELYDGLPLLSKWIEVINHSGEKVTLNRFKSEILALVEAESAVDSKSDWTKPNVSVETDFRFGGMSPDNLYTSSIAWNEDPLYKTQVNYEMTSPVLLEAYPKLGPEKVLGSGERLESFRTWELFHDSWDRERKGLAERRMYRSQAPWTTENPIMMHVRKADEESVKLAIDQCAEVGFEMVIMTFGSGFQIENDSPENIDRMKKLADYAHSKGVALGGYSLLASRKISPEHDVVMPEGQVPRFGNSPCLESEWGIAYFEKLYKFYEATGQDMLEHDGSYPGDVCASHQHPGHSGLEDSQWNQYEKIRDFYEWSRGKGIYLNVPDHYFMAGSNKTGMGYRETNWSLPRAQQEIIERQNIFDGTWQKTPSMGWMFVPLVEYHGGGKEATIEPLKDHLPHYEQRLANLFGAGVQACFRGPQLYDSPETKSVVEKWVDFYKTHRKVLDGDVIHIRRPDGRDFDGLLHVNSQGEERGLIMLYNPLEVPIQKEITVDLYYTGLDKSAELTDSQGKKQRIELTRDYKIALQISIPAKSQQWFVIK